MPFVEPHKPGDTLDTVRKVGRVAQLLLELRAEYERRPNAEVLRQIVARAAEINQLAGEIDVPVPPSVKAVTE